MALIYSVVAEVPFDFSVAQVRQPLFVEMSDGRIQNSYELKINNKTDQRVPFVLELEGLPSAELDLGQVQNLHLQPEQSLRLFARVRVNPKDMETNPVEFRFRIQLQGEPEALVLEQPAFFHKAVH